MRRPRPLPRRLGDRFTTREAAAAGVGRSRRDAADLARPFHGVRSIEVPATFGQLVDCYRTVMRPGQLFVGITAMRLWGLPHPRRWTPAEPLHIAVAPDAAPPRGRGVRGRRLSGHRAERWRVARAAVVDPVAALLSSAGALAPGQVLAALDALLTRSDLYPGLMGPRPLTDRETLQRRLAEWGRFPGSARVRAALALARENVESPKESETRVLIVTAGLPEPVVQWDVVEDGRFVARVDLAYPELRIAIEYEGDGHRVDRTQWRTDIRRQRRLEDLGWIVIRLTQADLDAPAEFLARLRRAWSVRSAEKKPDAGYAGP